MADNDEESDLSRLLSRSAANAAKKVQKSRDDDSSLSSSRSVLSSVFAFLSIRSSNLLVALKSLGE